MADPVQDLDGFIFDPYANLTGSTLASTLLFKGFTDPPGCTPCRTETSFNIKIGGKLYKFVLRDKALPEDHYLVSLKAAAFSISRIEQYRGTPPPRNVRDFLVKENIFI
jgi:hypothetical protein